MGLRIGGGSPRAFYVGIATPEGERALCVVPRHLEEGSRVSVPRPFTLALGRPVRFPLLASVRPRLEQPGEVVQVDDQLTPLPPLEAVLQDPGAGRGAAEVPVRLEAVLTEIGTLELWCVATDREARWKLEFGLRAAQGDRPEPRASLGPSAPRMAEAVAIVDLYYGKRAAVNPRSVKELFPRWRRSWVRGTAGPRRWCGRSGRRFTPAPVGDGAAPITSGCGCSSPGSRSARGSARRWTPGGRARPSRCSRTGSSTPPTRMPGSLVGAVATDRGWARRALPGAHPGRRGTVRPTADPRRPPPRVPGVRPEALDELIRLAGSLERIPPARKMALGRALLDRLTAEGPAPHVLWALGRLGARVPFHGSAHQVVSADEAEAWTRRLLGLEASAGMLVFPLSQLARRSGDRDRDLPDALREEVAAALTRGGATPEAVNAVEQVAAPSEEEDRRDVSGRACRRG